MASSCHDQVRALDDILREVGISVEDLNNRCSDAALTEITRIGYDWEVIATELGLSEAHIYDIKEEHIRAEMRRIRAFTKWKESTRNPATYRTLVSAFLARERLQNAREICEIVKHQKAISSSGQHTVDEPVNVLTSQFTGSMSLQPANPSISIRDIRRRLERKFASVQRRLMNSNGVTLRGLTQCVATLPSFRSEAPTLLKATSVEEFFHELKNYCTTLNPDILEDLVEELGDEETKERLGDFTREYEDLNQMKLCDLIGNFEDSECMPPGHKELKLKLGDNWHEKTLADLKRLKEQISLKHWFLKFITGGSITVTYLVPNSETLHLLQNLEDFCQSQDVLSISMGGKLLYEGCSPAMPTRVHSYQADDSSPTAATEVHLKRNVLVLGKLGVGKTTVCYQILSVDQEGPLTAADTYVTPPKGGFYMHSGSIRHGNEVYDINIVEDIIYYIGINDMILNHLEKLHALLSDKTPEGIHLVLFVVKLGRWTLEEDRMLQYLTERYPELSSITAMVITGCENNTHQQRQQVIQEFSQQHKGDFMQKGIYCVGFPDLRVLLPAYAEIFKERMIEDQSILRNVVYNADKAKKITFNPRVSNCNIM